MMRSLLRVLVLLAALVGAGVIAPSFLPGGAVQAQEGATAPDYTMWETVAKRAEEAVSAARASNDTFELLRSELVNWRDKFAAAQDTNALAIGLVRKQLEALGPPPETGKEALQIAEQRKALETRLSELEAPGKLANAAYSRADGLIVAIDGIIRDRQAGVLTERGPSPLNAAYWGPALSSVSRYVSKLGSEISDVWGNAAQRKQLQNNLPLVLALLVVALLLLARGRTLMKRFLARLRKANPGPVRWVILQLLSFGEVVLPVVGLLVLAGALMLATGLSGLRLGGLVPLIPAFGLPYFAAQWIGGRMFAEASTVRAPLVLSSAHQRTGRWLSAALGLLYSFKILVQEVASNARWEPSITNTLLFPVLVLMAFVLFRIGRLMKLHPEAPEADSPDITYRDQIIQMIGRALGVVAVVGPLIAAIGYVRAANALLGPTALSLAVLAVLAVLRRMIAGAYALVIGDEEAARSSLLLELASFALVLASTPVLALIWGARTTDLAELWTRFQAGITVGGTRISPGIFLTFAIVFSIGYMITRMVQSTIRTSILPKTRIDPGGQAAIVSGIGYLGMFLAALVAITTAGINLSSLAIVAGALSVGIGFGLQNIVSNFVSGIILLIERPITEGDWIEVGNYMGYVRDISVRSTRIETFDRSDVIVPNADLVSGTVVNYTRGNLIGRVIIPVGVAYGTDTHKVSAILKEIAEAHPLVMLNPAPSVHFIGFGADSLDFQIRAILRDVNFSLSVKTEINHEIARRFAEEGIEIPFAQRDIWLRNPEALRPEAPDAPEETPESKGNSSKGKGA